MSRFIDAIDSKLITLLEAKKGGGKSSQKREHYEGEYIWYKRDKKRQESDANTEARRLADYHAGGRGKEGLATVEPGTETRGLAGGGSSPYEWESAQGKALSEIWNAISQDAKGAGVTREQLLSSVAVQWLETLDPAKPIQLTSRQGYFVPIRYQIEQTPAKDFQPVDPDGKPTEPVEEDDPERPGFVEPGVRFKRSKLSGKALETERLKAAARTMRQPKKHGSELAYDKAIPLPTGNGKALSKFKAYLRYRLRAAGKWDGDTVLEMRDGRTIVGNIMKDESDSVNIALEIKGRQTSWDRNTIEHTYSSKQYSAKKQIAYPTNLAKASVEDLRAGVFAQPNDRTGVNPLADALTEISGMSPESKEETIKALGRIKWIDGDTLYIMPIRDEEGSDLIAHQTLWDLAQNTITIGPENKLFWKNTGEPVIVAANVNKASDEPIGAQVVDDMMKSAASKKDDKKNEKLKKTHIESEQDRLKQLTTTCLTHMMRIATKGAVKLRKDPTWMVQDASEYLKIPVGGGSDYGDEQRGDGILDMTFDDVYTADDEMSSSDDPEVAPKQAQYFKFPGMENGYRTTSDLDTLLKRYLELRGTDEASRRITNNKLWIPQGFQKDSATLKKYYKYFTRKVLTEIRKDGAFLDLYMPVQLTSPPMNKIRKNKNTLKDDKRPTEHESTNWSQYVNATILRPTKQTDPVEDAQSKQSEALTLLRKNLINAFSDLLEPSDVIKIVENLKVQDIIKSSAVSSGGMKGSEQYVISILPFMKHLDALAADDEDPVIQKEKDGSYTVYDDELIKPYSSRIAAKTSGRVNPEDRDNRVYGLSVIVPSGKDNAAYASLDNWLEARGDSSETDQLFWMSGEKLDKKREQTQHKIIRAIKRSASEVEAPETEIKLGDWNKKFDSGKGMMNSDRYITIEPVHNSKVTNSPEVQKKHFSDTTSAWEEDPNNKPINIDRPNTWPSDIQSWVKKWEGDPNRKNRHETTYENFLKNRLKEEETLEAKKFGDVRWAGVEKTGMRQKTPEWADQAGAGMTSRPRSLGAYLPASADMSEPEPEESWYQQYKTTAHLYKKGKGIEIPETLTAKYPYDEHMAELKKSLVGINDINDKLSKIEEEAVVLERLIEEPNNAVVYPDKERVKVDPDGMQKLAYDLDELYSHIEEKWQMSSRWSSVLQKLSSEQDDPRVLRHVNHELKNMSENDMNMENLKLVQLNVEVLSTIDTNPESRQHIIDLVVSNMPDLKDKDEDELAKIGEKTVIGQLKRVIPRAEEDIKTWLTRELTKLGVEALEVK